MGGRRRRREERSEELHKTTPSSPPVLPRSPTTGSKAQLQGPSRASPGGRGHAPGRAGRGAPGKGFPHGVPQWGSGPALLSGKGRHHTLQGHFLPPNEAGERGGTGEARAGGAAEASRSRDAFPRALQCQDWRLQAISQGGQVKAAKEDATWGVRGHVRPSWSSLSCPSHILQIGKLRPSLPGGRARACAPEGEFTSHWGSRPVTQGTGAGGPQGSQEKSDSALSRPAQGGNKTSVRTSQSTLGPAPHTVAHPPHGQTPPSHGAHNSPGSGTAMIELVSSPVPPGARGVGTLAPTSDIDLYFYWFSIRFTQL